MTELSNDAIIFGIGFTCDENLRLSFGGEGSEMEITPRARAALDELIAAKYATIDEADTSIVGREYYRGTPKQPRLVVIMIDRGLDVFGDKSLHFPTFVKKS